MAGVGMAGSERIGGGAVEVWDRAFLIAAPETPQRNRVRIKDAETLCKRLDAQAVVMLVIERNGTVRTATYGETREKCRCIGEWAAALMRQSLTTVPFRTMFGFGCEGVPTPLTSWECANLTASAQKYALDNTAQAHRAWHNRFRALVGPPWPEGVSRWKDETGWHWRNLRTGLGGHGFDDEDMALRDAKSSN